MKTDEILPLAGTPLDYSNKENWMIFDTNDNIDHDVDVFFLYPTSVDASVKTEICEDLEKMKQNAHSTYLQCGEEFAPLANIYAPYYRQISAIGIMQNLSTEALLDEVRRNVTRTDAFAALDYYFKNCNNGKPYILASHSQGSFTMKLIIAEYMKMHPEYMKKMIACYAIGCYFPDEWFDVNPHIKKATGETDTGCLITWNTEGPNATDTNIAIGNYDGFVINPLNWRTDETPADISQNRGSAFIDVDMADKIYGLVQEQNDKTEGDSQYLSNSNDEIKQSIKDEIITYTDGVADAIIDKRRGVIVTNTYTNFLPNNPLFGDKSCHTEDCSLFFMNIRENAKKRISAFIKEQK